MSKKKSPSRKSAIEAPKLPPQLDNIITLDPWIHPEECFRLGVIKDCTLGEQIIESAVFDTVLFKNVTFEATTFNHLEATDVIFENCDLSNVKFREAIIHRAELRHCKAVGLDLGGAHLRNVFFDACNLNYASFYFSNCKKVKFQDCSLISADFSNSTLLNTELGNANIDKAQFVLTKLEGIDFSQCHFESIGITAEYLKGCMIAPEQAVAFSQALGLIVKDA